MSAAVAACVVPVVACGDSGSTTESADQLQSETTVVTSDATDDATTDQGDEVEAGDTAPDGGPTDDAGSDGATGVATDEESPLVVRVSGGVLYMEGRIGSEQSRQLMELNLTVVIGDDIPIVNNLVVDETVPEFPAGAPVVIEDVILFDTASAEIRDEFKPLINAGAKMLIALPELSLDITARADSVGPDDLNLVLSQERAQAVKDHLVSQGAPEDRITTTGLGEEGASAGTSDDERALDRRAEFYFNADQPITSVAGGGGDG
ncbi:MAG: OmpA family protein [Acidimicrobiales bacterium]